MRYFNVYTVLAASLVATTSGIPVLPSLIARRLDDLAIHARNELSQYGSRELVDDTTMYMREADMLPVARDSFDFDAIVARANGKTPAQNANAIIKAQGSKKSDPKVLRLKKKMVALNPGAGTKEGTQAQQKAVADAKAQRTAKWAKKLPPKPKAPKPPKMSADEKKAAADHLKAAGEKMRATTGIPNRKDTYKDSSPTPNDAAAKSKSIITNSVPKANDAAAKKDISGKDVRKAVFNSNVNEARPIGRNGKHPKQFNNDPYSPTHKVTTLAGKPVIPGLGAGNGREFPVLSGSPTGWTGTQPVGAARVITEKGQGGNPDKFHGVIAHDKTKGGDDHDHYLIPKVPKKP